MSAILQPNPSVTGDNRTVTVATVNLRQASWYVAVWALSGAVEGVGTVRIAAINRDMQEYMHSTPLCRSRDLSVLLSPAMVMIPKPSANLEIGVNMPEQGVGSMVRPKHYRVRTLVETQMCSRPLKRDTSW